MRECPACGGSVSDRASDGHHCGSRFVDRADVVRRHRMQTYALQIAGGLFMAAGLYFLLVAPGDGAAADVLGEGVRVANLHRLTLGETFTIAGAIFLAAAWRPR